MTPLMWFLSPHVETVTEKWKKYIVCMQVMLTFGVLCQLALSVSETDWSYSANAPSYLPNADQSVLRNYLVPVLQQILIKFWLKKSDVYHMHVRFLVHAVNWSVLFIRTCGLSSASARQTSLLCLGFLLLYSALLLFSVIGVYLGTSLPSPYMLCSNVRILVLRSRHVPDISVPQLTIYIW